MDEELKKRFTIQKLKDLLSDNSNLLPTIICEREIPEIEELVRKYCLFSENMLPYQVKHNLSLVSERLDFQCNPISWGELYILVNVN